MHRDIKPPNILINGQGEAVLTDFDLARHIPKEYVNMTKNLVTRWYRAPEIIYGSTEYTEAIDIWSFGCVMGELLMEKPMFPGNSEIDQLQQIFKIRGTPKKEDWPEVFSLKNFFEFEKITPVDLKKLIPKATT